MSDMAARGSPQLATEKKTALHPLSGKSWQSSKYKGLNQNGILTVKELHGFLRF